MCPIQGKAEGGASDRSHAKAVTVQILQSRVCKNRQLEGSHHIRKFHQDQGTLRDKKKFECGVCKKVFGE